MPRSPMERLCMALGCAALLAAPVALANQMRGFEPIPSAARDRQDLPDGAELVLKPEAIPRGEVAEAAEAVADAWNGPGLSELISDAKFDKDRFDRAMITEVPRDATLSLESVRGVQTLNQAIMPDGQGGFTRVSTVSATISTRLVVNDPIDGFVNAPGVNEVIFQVSEPVR